MRKLVFSGFATGVEASRRPAEKYLKDKKEGATVQCIYDNGYANWIKKNGEVVINE